METKDLIPIIISGVALAISLFTTWNTSFSPFRIKIYSGNPRLEYMPLKLENGIFVTRFTPIINLFFVNLGALGGVITDVMLEVASGKNRWLYQPFFYTKFTIQPGSTYGIKLLKDASNEPFYPINLPGKSNLIRTIAFSPLAHEKFPLGKEPFKAGSYKFKIKIYNKILRSYRTKTSFIIILNQEHIDNLSKGDNILPFLKETNDRRLRIK